MLEERKRRFEEELDRMGEEMEILAERFGLTETSEVIALYQTYFIRRLDLHGIATI